LLEEENKKYDKLIEGGISWKKLRFL
jgi:hypothetical protein